MSKPFCSSGEPWDVESMNLEDLFRVIKDTSNDDVLIIVNPGRSPWFESRLSPDGALRLALTIMKAAIGLDGDQAYELLKDYLSKNEQV